MDRLARFQSAVIPLPPPSFLRKQEPGFLHSLYPPKAGSQIKRSTFANAKAALFWDDEFGCGRLAEADGGRGRTRTYEAVKQGIYSPPPLPLGTLSPDHKTSGNKGSAAKAWRCMPPTHAGVKHGIRVCLREPLTAQPEILSVGIATYRRPFWRFA